MVDDSNRPTLLAIARAGAPDLGEIVAMLAGAGLPTVDVADHLARFLVARVAGGLVAVAGAQMLGEHVLLRSVCVSSKCRHAGLATRLCEGVLEDARRDGGSQAHLLTTTAPGFFERLGFGASDRSGAPDEVRATAEFRTLCPASAVYMTKPL